MRVAFYAPLKPPDHPVPSGDRRIARLLMTAIKNAGHHVTIASRLRTLDRQGDRQNQEMIKRRGMALANRYILRHAENPPDLWFTYHLYHKAPDWLGPAISQAFSIPYVVAEASVAPKQAGGPWAMGHETVCTALHRARRVLVLNPDDIECLAPIVAEPSRLFSVPPFIDTKPPRHAAAARETHRRRLAERFRLDRNKVWIAVTAMMRSGDKLDSYRVLGKTAHRLRDLPLVWLVAGDGPERATVEAMLDGTQVVYLGASDRADVDALHAAADIAVWPAIREAFGMALLEAQAAGLPIVAGASPGVAQIVENEITGLLTPSSDDTMLAEAVRRLIQAPELRREMSARAMQKAEQVNDLVAATQHIDRLLRTAQEEQAS
jgi:glycosyltransferase involved in cell wall biosynthesis